MAVPVLKLNLAPPSTFWRSHHGPLGWSALVLGGLVLAGSVGFTVQAYRSAAQAAKRAGILTAQTRTTAETQAKILADLRSIDVAKELPRWRLAERIFTERSLPWSRLTSELERSLVQDVRIKSLQRNRGTDMKVQLKLKGEARTRAAEAAFVESLQKNHFFEQVLLEREGERQGGGVEFDYTLAVSPTPPPYLPLPKYGPKVAAGIRMVPAPQHAVAAVPPPQHSSIAVPPPPTRVRPAGPMGQTHLQNPDPPYAVTPDRDVPRRPTGMIHALPSQRRPNSPEDDQ
jgi:hypothetical protein